MQGMQGNVCLKYARARAQRERARERERSAMQGIVLEVMRSFIEVMRSFIEVMRSFIEVMRLVVGEPAAGCMCTDENEKIFF